MAKISGVTGGLNAGSFLAAAAPKKKKQIEPEVRVDKVCEACNGIIERPTRRRSPAFATDSFDGMCRFCCSIFGVGPYIHGVTSVSPEEAKKRLADLRLHQFGMILRRGIFGSRESVIEVEPGDIFQIKRAGITVDQDEPMCSAARSKELFSVEIEIGPISLLLWLHEISAISFATIMELKRLGEIEESFVATEDQIGYFKPNDTMRAMIYESFGSLVNA